MGSEMCIRDSPKRAAPLLDLLKASDCAVHCIPGEPTLSDITEGVRAAAGREGVVAIGGGSAIDAGKAIAALTTNPGEPLDYLEVIGRGQPLTETPLPFIAIPTTAGTGAEVTRNAVITCRDQRVKVSLRHPRMLPAVAIVDPAITHDLPPAITAATGMDALTQLIEPFTCRRANPLTDALCREAIPRAARALPRAIAACAIQRDVPASARGAPRPRARAGRRRPHPRVWTKACRCLTCGLCAGTRWRSTGPCSSYPRKLVQR